MDSGRREIIDKLESMCSTDTCFFVFNTEESRDRAVEKARDLGGLEIVLDCYQMGSSRAQKDGIRCTVDLQQAVTEPDGLYWDKLTRWSAPTLFVRCVLGIFAILFALILWGCCFYLPYAYSVMETDYAHGTDPNLLEKTLFGFIVVGGNALMYFVCAEVADRVGFRYKKSRETYYVLSYCAACVVNVLVDLGMAYHMAYRMMVGLHYRTHDGTPLGDVKSFMPRFETYAMQKSLGRLLLDYSVPSTFLVPFLLEPIFVIYLPFQTMVLIVRSHPSIIGASADAYLAMPPMDLSRYADVLLNMLLATMVFFFPGGYVVMMFAALIFSHIFIYAYDHVRILRLIPTCDFATHDVAWWAEWMFSMPCGILLSCTAFKANCQDLAALPGPLPRSTHCWESDAQLIDAMVSLFVLHVVVHTLVLLYVVPLFHMKSLKQTHGYDYKKVSQRLAASWFASNPVHCLRSKYLHRHFPPCDYYIPGKDWLLRRNLQIHAHYSAPKPDLEDMTALIKPVGVLANEAAQKVKQRNSREDSGLSTGLSPSELGLSPASKPVRKGIEHTQSGLASEPLQPIIDHSRTV
jgi:hypothetical protein